MDPRSRPPSSSSHPVGKPTPRKRNRRDPEPGSPTKSTTPFSVSSTSASHQRDATQQRPRHQPSSRTGGENLIDNKEGANAPSRAQRQVAESQNNLVLHQRTLLNTPERRQEEVGDDMPDANARQTRQRLGTQQPSGDRVIQGYQEAKPFWSNKVEDERQKIQDPTARKEIFTKEIQNLLRSQSQSRGKGDKDEIWVREGIDAYRRAVKEAEQDIAECPRLEVKRSGRMIITTGQPSHTDNTSRPERSDASRSDTGLWDKSHGPYSNISETEMEMALHLILGPSSRRS